MLTGDNDEIAQKVATEVGLTGYKASLLPQNKVEEVEELFFVLGLLIFVETLYYVSIIYLYIKKIYLSDRFFYNK